MLINGNLVRGKLTGHSALSAVCDVFKTKPDFCKEIHKILEEEISENYSSELDRDDSYVLIYICLVFMSLILLALIVSLFRWNFREQIESHISREIHDSIGDYKKIGDVSNITNDTE